MTVLITQADSAATQEVRSITWTAVRTASLVPAGTLIPTAATALVTAVIPSAAAATHLVAVDTPSGVGDILAAAIRLAAVTVTNTGMAYMSRLAQQRGRDIS